MKLAIFRSLFFAFSSSMCLSLRPFCDSGWSSRSSSVVSRSCILTSPAVRELDRISNA